MYVYIYMYMKAGRGPQGDSIPDAVSKAEGDSFSQTLTGLTEGHLAPEAALGVGLSCLCCIVSGPKSRKLFGA